MNCGLVQLLKLVCIFAGGWLLAKIDSMRNPVIFKIGFLASQRGAPTRTPFVYGQKNASFRTLLSHVGKLRRKKLSPMSSPVCPPALETRVVKHEHEATHITKLTAELQLFDVLPRAQKSTVSSDS